MSATFWKVTVGFLVVTLFACGTPSTQQTPLTWSQMNRQQKIEFMGVTYFEAMKKMFAAFDPKVYDGVQNFGCQHCHGANHEQIQQKMPNTLFPLDPNNLPTRNDPDARTAMYVKFMEDQVLPKTKELLQLSTFTCFGCHSKKQ